MRQKPLSALITVGASLALGGAACPDAAPAPPQNQPPVAVAGGYYAGQDTIHFDGRSSHDPDGDLPLVYHWDFGDGNTDTGATAAHLYTSDGGYTVTLTVTDARGASSPAASTAAHVQASPLVLLAAGNISSCGSNWDDLTARILDTIPGTVLTLGDNAFPNGSATNYQTCYDPTWGRHKARTYATLGNHEYDTGTADGAFDYFGERVGARGQGYYSFNLGAWHVIVLNSNGAFVPFAAGTAQDQWLQADLAANTRKCTLATWHHARFFSSSDPGFTASAPIKILWDRLYPAGADVVLHAYLHHYERLAPMTPDGAVDNARGIRAFMVGTGGESLGMPSVIAANSEVRGAAFGVLKLTLYADRYTWEFKPIEGETFTDAGSGTCH